MKKINLEKKVIPSNVSSRRNIYPTDFGLFLIQQQLADLVVYSKTEGDKTERETRFLIKKGTNCGEIKHEEEGLNFFRWSKRLSV